MKERANFVIIGLAVLTMVLLFAATVFAEPDSPSTLNHLGSGRGDLTLDGSSVYAQAGNVTALNINATSLTKVWQGYYGNVTGAIKLDDANNWTMYDWDFSTPSGEVFATEASSVTWETINCTNLTHIEAEETAKTIGPTDIDGINETFNDTTHPEVYVGSVQFVANHCDYTTSTYQNDATGSDFEEILLYESGGEIVYTTLINDNKNSFNNHSADFQLIVAEDGHGAAAATSTQYYFYVELSKR